LRDATGALHLGADLDAGALPAPVAPVLVLPRRADPGDGPYRAMSVTDLAEVRAGTLDGLRAELDADCIRLARRLLATVLGAVVLLALIARS
jgi:hypothetical protein